MKQPIKLLSSVVVCELVGVLSTPFTIMAIPTWYAGLNKPFFSPPNWVFGPVWTLLYFLMGVAAYLIWIKGVHHKNVKAALGWFLVQLSLNFLWSFLFFGIRMPLLAFIDIVLLGGAIALTIKKFFPLSRNAALLLVPYFLWVSFASLLNLAIILLN